MKKLRIPRDLDLSVLEFLQHGDKELIAAEDRKLGYKTDRSYVSRVCKGSHRNDRILLKAIELALKRKGNFPLQVIRYNYQNSLPGKQ
jgi:hypothetical protein